MSEFSLRISTGIPLIGEALFESSYLIWKTIFAIVTSLNSNLLQEGFLSLINICWGAVEIVLLLFQLDPENFVIGSKAALAVEITKFSVMFTK